MKLLSEDYKFLENRGSNPDTVKSQFSNFKNGFPFIFLDRPATIDDGIVRMEDSQIEELVADYSDLTEGKSITKFVPSSGAATRMFKELYSYLENEDLPTVTKAKTFLLKLSKFPFYNDLEEVMRRDGYELHHEIEYQNYKLIIHYLLEKRGLNYGNEPKGLLKFHVYDEEIRTSVEEHLVEAALYATDNQHNCRIHFTVSPSHKSAFEALINKKKSVYEKRFGVKYLIDYSIQDPKTDTLAAELDNTPFRDEKGNLLFRPAGHGALINNLNQIHSDIVFVKNIDNVIKEDKIETTVIYKKAMAAYLIELQKQTFHYLRKIKNNEVDEMDMCEILDFAETMLMIHLPDDDLSLETLYQKMNRPIRICGMVKNEGEPGGGPFWVCRNEELSLQIVETSQIDMNNPQQKKIVEKATHFNPVDLVCSFMDYQGNYFDLSRYVDENTGFISTKSYGERTLKAMELPGLWNGAMSEWITIFVEVPLITFNPVKTVFDLLNRD